MVQSPQSRSTKLEQQMPITWKRETEYVVEEHSMRLAERPITFERFLKITDEDDDFELVKGALQPKMSAKYPHERRFVWLQFILNGFVRKLQLGAILGSRSAVEINEFTGRLPDILFISKDRENIIKNDAI